MAQNLGTQSKLTDLVATQVQKTPESVAVIFDGMEERCCLRITYCEMWLRANMVCEELQHQGVTTGTIGVCTEPGINLPSVLLGIMRASLSFFPFGVDGKGFVKQSLQKLGVRYLLLDDSNLQSLQSMLTELDVKIVPTTSLQFLGLYLVKICPPASVKPLQSVPGLAYCITTSGTTGTPKIVRVPHSCVLPNILDFKAEFKPDVGDTTFLTSPLTFDPSMIDIFMTLTSGAALLIVSPVVKMSPDSLLNVLSSRYKVTILQMTPSLFRQLDPRCVRERLLGKDSALRILAFGGETFPDDKCLHACLHPENITTIYNVYGITEVSCWATLHCARCPKGPVKDSVPIGRPLTGTGVKVLGEQGEELKHGVGHIWIGGSQRTCLLNEEGEEVLRGSNVWRKTGDLGVIHPDGSIYCMGRLDRQIKRNGKRLDLDTLEKVCCQLSSVAECLVIHSEDKLHLFVKTRQSQNEEDIIRKVKGHVKDTLPAQYQPNGVTMVSIFPVNSHGKLDVVSLLQMSKVKTETCKPTSVNDAESWCSTLWQDILEDGKVTPSPSDRFLYCGGDSLKAVHLMERVEECLGREIPDLLDIVLTKTFGDFVREIRRQWTLVDMSTTTSQASENLDERQLCSRKRDFDPDEKNEPPVKRKKHDFVHEKEHTEVSLQTKKCESDKDLDVIESPVKLKKHDDVQNLDVTAPLVKIRKQTSDNLCGNLEVSDKHHSSDLHFNRVIYNAAKQTHAFHSNAQTQNDAFINGKFNKDKRKPFHQKLHQTELKRCCKEAKCTFEDVSVNSIDRLTGDCARLHSHLPPVCDHDLKTQEHVSSHTPFSHQHLFLNSIGRANRGLQANTCTTLYSSLSVRDIKMCSSVPVGGVSEGEVSDTKLCSKLAKASDAKTDSNLSVTNAGDTKMCSKLSVAKANDRKMDSNLSVTNAGHTKMCTNLSVAKTLNTKTCSNQSIAKASDTIIMDSKLSVTNTSETKVCCSLSTDPIGDLKSERHLCSHHEKSRHGRDAVELHPQWSFDTGKCVDASPLIVTTRSGRTVVFIGSHSHRFFAISVECGTQLWSVELGDRVESSACLSPCGQYVIVGCYDHHIYVLQAGTGEVEWRVRTGDVVKCSPVSHAVSCLVFCGSHDGCLYALHCQTQNVSWTSHLGGGGVFASPVVSHDGTCVFAATLAGHVTAVTMTTGARLWSVSVGKPVFSSPALRAHRLYVGCVDSSLYCLSAVKGSQVWVHKTGAPIFSSPVIVKRDSTQRSSILVGCHDNCLYCISDTGELEWKYPTQSTVYASPFVFCPQNIQHNVNSRYASLKCSENVDQRCCKCDVDSCLTENQTESCKVRQFHNDYSERTLVKEPESERKVCKEHATHSTNKSHNEHQTYNESEIRTTNRTGSEHGTCKRCETLSTNKMEIPSESYTRMKTLCTNIPKHNNETCEHSENFATNHTRNEFKTCEQLVAHASTKSNISSVSCEKELVGQTVLPGEVFRGTNTYCKSTPEHQTETMESSENFATTNTRSEHNAFEQINPCASTKGTVKNVSCENEKLVGQTVLPDGVFIGTNTYCTNMDNKSEACVSTVKLTANNAGSEYKSCEHLVACASTKGTVSIVSCETGRLVGRTVLPGEVFSSPVIVGDRLVVGCRDDRVYCYKLTFF